MKFFYARFTAAMLLVTAITTGNNLYAQGTDNDKGKDKDSKGHLHRPAQWPKKQVITKKTIQLGRVHIVNFQQLADSEKALNLPPFRTGFIEQGEDRDAGYKFIPHKIPKNTPTFDPDKLVPRLANKPQMLINSPAPTGYFLGTSSNGSEIPPDVDGAAGPVYVLETNNQQYDIYNKTGALQATLQINTFFASTGGNGFYDPHVLYDAVHQKFILVSDGFFGTNGANPGGVFIGISETSDPTGNWYTYSVNDGDNTKSDLLDYPEVGYNNNWVAVTFNDFLSNSTPVDIYVFDRASLYSGTLGTTTLFTDNNAFSWAPAQTYDTTEDTLWMVQDGNGASGAMQIGCITGTAAAPVYNAGSNIAVTQTWNEGAIDVGQAGGGTTKLINDDDDRVGNGSVYINGTLWFTHTIYLPATGTAAYSGVDWWQIVPSGLTLKQFGRIADPNGNTNYYYPSLNVNSNGDALLGYCLSGTDSFYPSAAYSFHAAADPVNYMESRYIYKAGTVTYYETLGRVRNRYGDFTGTSVDPNDLSFWNYSEYPVNATKWGIVIAHVPASVPPTNPPVAGFMASDTAFTCSGLVQFTDLSSNLPTSWLWNFGDGDTSTQQNPSHLYTTNGTFSVSLKATNSYGSGSQSLTSYITISLPAGPPAANVTHCSSSSFSLSASTTNNVGWFDSGGTLVSTANPFVTPVINHTTTYWVQDTVPGSTDSVGPATYTTLGTGGIFTNTNAHELTFDALSDFTLISVVVDASTAGTRTIQLINPAGTVIATATPNVPVGVSTVTLNFSVPAGTGYELSLGGTVNLYRNDGAGTINYYPFTIAGVVSITGCDAGPGYYYYFYNWKVKGPSCVSARTPVNAVIGAGGLTITPAPREVTCFGDSTGSVAVAVSGGTPVYTYKWNNGQTADTAVNLAAGPYFVTITDAGGCSSTASATVGQPAVLTAGTTATNAACYGANNGAVTVTASGGTATYTYNWGGGVTAQKDSGVAAGTYTVTVTDAHLCTVTASGTVSQPATALTAGATVTNATCYGGNNGAVTVTASGGTASYTYNWGSGVTAQKDTGLAAGTYTVTVTDAHLCTTTASRTVSQPGTALTAGTTITNATCYGGNNGAVTVTASGGTATYAYNWGGGVTAQTDTGVAAGTYTVTVTDAHLCTVTASGTVGQATAVTAIATSSNAGCGSSSSGTASVSAGGGSGSYTYLWSTTQTTDSISNLGGGTYKVTVTDAHSCTATASTTVTNAGSLSLITSGSAVSCYGGANGTASVSATGNTGNLTYTWSNSDTGVAITNLTAGNYVVTASNGTGCSTTSSAMVNQPGAITISFISTNASCGVSNGSITVNASGGTSGYSYLWNTSAATNSISGLGAGIYRVTVTDAHSCTADSSATIISAATLASNISSTNTSCYGDSTGTATIAATSGNAPYTYSWSNGTTGDSISGLPAGTYFVTITDNLGCKRSDTTGITQPNAISIIINASQPSCGGPATGSASLAVTGGSSGYTYAWSDGSTTNNVSGLAGGVYRVTVYDANNCSSSAALSIDSLPILSTVITAANDSCHGGSDGEATVVPSGGAGPYVYAWSNGGTAASIANLVAGIYKVTVNDAHNCSGTASVIVAQPGELMVAVSAANATNGQSNGGITIDSITGGVAPYQVTGWSNGGSGDSITNLAPGIYTVTVTDNNGCRQTATDTVKNITGTEDVADSIIFSVYPNPARTEVVVEVQTRGTQTEVWLKDILSQVLYIRPISSAKTVIDLSPYASGVYFIEITEGQERATKKLVIEK